MIKEKRTIYDAKTTYYHEYNEKMLSIGEYQEKALHAILKNFFEIDKEKTEVKIGQFIADIYNEYGIIEIQTKSFDRLRKKLDYFLEKYDVTIVYPIIKNKKITWLNSENEKDYNRISPRHKDIFSAFKELYKIKTYLNNPRLHFDFVFLDIIEFKNLDGYDNTKKKHSTSYEKFPIDICEEIKIDNYKDFKYIFEDINESFTVKSLSKLKKSLKSDVGIAMTVLSYLGIIKRIDENKREHVYEKVEIC